ncbi:restriction endonuclease subunit S [Enterococcus faecium]|uniref:restriction endonuclease subunit S n=1 Tax=Enterococcus faecium TaxID=1352 RepID=UPI003CE465E7
MSNNTQPEIRFPGFTEDWEERKLNEGMTEYTDRVYIQDDEIYKQVSVKNVGEITLRGEQIGSKIGRKRQAKVNLIEHPDTLIFTRQTIEQGGIGFAPKETDGAIVTENMPTIDVDNDIINCNYLLAYVKTEDWYRKVILKNIEGGTAQIAIHEDSILSSEVLIPKIEEQQKIGTFFKQIDDTIALHQRKLDLLKETKKGFLQKMFPKNGAKVPEIRFPGFTKDWEERKLGDVFSERSERSSEGELISVTINSGVIKASELDRKDNSSDNKSNYKKVEVGDIAYNSMRMWQGASGYSSYEGILSPAYTVIIPKEGTDSKFFAYDFKRYDMIQTFKRNSQGLTSDTWNLKFPTLKLVKIMVPSIEEQKQIAAFFERLDNTIALHERELDVLKETKKGFLQKMFV